jgi:hypothetical protein
VELLRDLYEESILTVWLDPDSTEPTDEEVADEALWLGEIRVGYDADILARIQDEPDWRWFG